MRSRTFLLLGGLAGLFLFGCSDDSSSDGSSSSSGSTSSSSGSSSGGSGDSGDGGGADGAFVNGCSAYEDRTADGASRVLKWDFQVFSLPEHCMKIKVGQTVTFSSDGAGAPGDFESHPIVGDGGDTPNPINGGVDKATGEVTFSAAGTFGYACNNHPAMMGAILVVE